MPMMGRPLLIQVAMRFVLLQALAVLMPASLNQPFLPMLPLPAAWTGGTLSATLDSATFRFRSTAGDTSKVLRTALERYTALTFPHTGKGGAATGRSTPTQPSAAAAVGMVVTVADAAVPLELGVNESYVLTVAADGMAACASETAWGALHCLESFSQLVSYDFTGQVYRTPPVLPLRVVDAPRFAPRGIMLDAGRHFLPVSQLQVMIDSLSYAKMVPPHPSILNFLLPARPVDL
jgi:hexosaminidase